MSQWFDFLRNILPAKRDEDTPGTIRIAFVNRYLEALDDISYFITVDGKSPVSKDIYGQPALGKKIHGKTTIEKNYVDISPQTLDPIKVEIYSRRANGLKVIDTITPLMNEPQLVYEHMKTFKIDSKTMPHPEATTSPVISSPTPKKIPTPPPPGPSPKTNQGVHAEHTTNDRGEPMQEVSRPIPDKITVEQLKKIFTGAKEDYLQQVADELNTDLKKYKLDTVLRRAHFFAQVREEAGNSLKANEESLNYLVGALNKFSYYKKKPEDAEKDGRIEELVRIEVTSIKNGKSIKTKKMQKKVIQQADQEKIANNAYGNREGNGPSSTGDGWKYRGKGIFQITLKNNYAAFNREYPNYWKDTNPDFVTNPERVTDFPYTIRSAVWFWVANNIYTLADAGATDEIVENVTVKINPAKLHLNVRQKNFRDLS